MRVPAMMPCEYDPSFPALYLGHVLQVASRFVGRKIDQMEAAGFQYLEQAATADFLLAVQSGAPDFTRLMQRNMNEAKTGADFEWWLGNGPLWTGLRVQAKRHYVRYTSGPRDYYGDLDKRVKKSGKLQVDLLIGDCNKRGLTPLHLFFESIAHAGPNRLAKCGNKIDGDLWGASIADSCEIQKLVQTNTLSGNDVRKALQPISCLPVCSASGGALVDRVMSAIRSRIWSDDRRRDAFPEPKALPTYVRQLLLHDGPAVGDLPHGLDAILVMSDEPI